jgi:hypothetical protein
MITTLFSVESKIISGEIYLRVQHLAIFPSCNPLSSRKIGFIPLCKHNEECRGALFSMIACQLSHIDNTRCPLCHGFLYCKKCSTDFQVQIQDLGAQGQALVITKWLNIGCGDTPLDFAWLRHISFKILQEQDENKMSPGTTRRTFEECSAVSQEMLRNRNESILLYRKFFNFLQCPAYVSWFKNWIWQDQ